jgi:hypothetical protein
MLVCMVARIVNREGGSRDRPTNITLRSGWMVDKPEVSTWPCSGAASKGAITCIVEAHDSH